METDLTIPIYKIGNKLGKLQTQSSPLEDK